MALLIIFVSIPILVPGIILKRVIIASVLIVIETILQLSTLDAPYVLSPLVLFCIILFAYYILLMVKDTLLRESHVLSQKHVCNELKSNIKADIQLLVKASKHAVYLTSSFYFIFIILLFSVVFRLDFALRFAYMFDLNCFFWF